MFSSGPNYTKLKTNLRLAVNRLKLLEKKKTELAAKSRKEIADYITMGKPDRARIRVEQIIREDYLVEAMEILEMFCDLILARFGLITQLKEMDEGICEAVSSIIWVAPRLQADVAELKVVADIFQAKYGKPFADSSRAGVPPSVVSDKLQHKMSIQAPPKLLVEKYLIEIAKIYNIEYEPDPQVMKTDQKNEESDGVLIDFNNGGNNLNGDVASPPGFVGYPQMPSLPPMPPLPPMNVPFNYPPGPSGGYHGGGGGMSMPPFSYNIPPNAPPSMPMYPSKSLPTPTSSTEKKDINSKFLREEKSNEDPPPYSSLSPDDNIENFSKPKPQPRSKVLPGSEVPDLPNVPSNMPEPDDSEIDFDDLSRRFEELKKRH